MSLWPTQSVTVAVERPVFAWEPPFGPGCEPGYPYPLVDRRDVEAVEIAALAVGGQLILPELGGLAVADTLVPTAVDGPLLVVVEDDQPALWRLDPATGLTVCDRGWPAAERLIHNPTSHEVTVPGWLGLPVMTLAPGASWPRPTGSPWADPLSAAELVLAGAWSGPLPSSYALAAVAALLSAGRQGEALALLDRPLAESPGVPPGLPPFVRAFVAGGEPPWRWEVEWGSGFARGRLARLALEYAVECHDDVLAHYHLGCVLADWGRWDQACTHWAAATEGTDAAEANRNLAFAARWHYGDERAAQAFYREALAIGCGPITLAEAAEMGVTP